jgi:hypothetical protein
MLLFDQFKKVNMFKTIHYLFDSFHINNTLIIKFTNMKISSKFIGTTLLLFILTLNAGSVFAQKKPVYNKTLKQQTQNQRGLKADVKNLKTRPTNAVDDVKDDSNKNVEDKSQTLRNVKHHSSEIVSMRSQNSFTVHEGENNYSQTTSNVPIHYKSGTDWKIINPTVVSNNSNEYPYKNIANTFQTYFPNSPSSGFSVHFGETLEMKDMLDARLIFEDIQGNEIFSESMNTVPELSKKGTRGLVYSDVYPSVDLVPYVSNNRRKADYFIRDASFLNLIPDAAEDLVFEEKFTLPEQWTAEQVDERIFFIDADKNIRGFYDVPIAFDNPASQNHVTETINFSENLQESAASFSNVSYELLGELNHYTLRLKVSIDWLQNESREFPIVIDPDITVDFTTPTLLYSNGSPWASAANSITLSPAATGGIITNYNINSYDDYANAYGRTFPSVYFYLYSWYSWEYNESYFDLRITSNGTSWDTGTGTNTSGMTTDFGSTSAFDGQSADNDFVITGAYSGGYGTRIGHFWYSTISYTSAVTVSSFTPASACEGELISISGSDLGSATSVTIGGSTASIISNSANHVDVLVPAGSASGVIGVTTSAGSGYSSQSLTVKAPPSNTSAGNDFTICNGGSSALAGSSDFDCNYTFTSGGGTYDNEIFWTVTTGASQTGTNIITQGAFDATGSGSYGAVAATTLDLSAYAGQTLYFNAFDMFGDSWNGAKYSVSYDGAVVINNGDQTPDDGASNFSFDLETSEAFTVVTSPTYLWSPSTGLSDANITNPNASPTVSTTYTLTATQSGCSSTDQVVATVVSQPSISTQPSNGTDICVGATPSTMSVVATGGSGSFTYQWYSNTSDSNSGGISIGSETSSTYVPDASTSGTTYYYCTVSDASSGCNVATSNTAYQTINTIAAGSVFSSVDGGITYSADQKVNQVQNPIYWQYNADGTNGTFAEFQYNWDNSSTYLNNFGGTSNPHNWGTGQTFGSDGIIYVRAKVTCGTLEAYTTNIPTDWVWNYGGNGNAPASAITASLSGSPSSVSSGGEMRIDQTISWSKPSSSFESPNYFWEYEWNNDGTWNSPWQALTNPATWSDNVGSNVSSGDAILTVRTKHYGSGGLDSYSSEFSVTLKKPQVTTSGSLSAFTTCEGSAATAQSINVSGSYLGSDVTVTAPTGFEVCTTSGGTYASSITYSPTNGILASSAVYVRLASTASGSPSGSVTFSATAATSATVAASGTVSALPAITTSTDLTTAANTCGETELTISHSGSGGNGEWSYTGGTVAYTSGSATDATVSVRPIPADVNTDITMTWTVDGGQVCDGETATKTINFNQPTSVSSPDTYCYLWGGLTSTDIATGNNWYKWDATNSMWERQSSAPSTSTDKLHVLTTDNNCIHASNELTLGTTTLASLSVGASASMDLGSGTVTLNGDLTNAGTIAAGSGTVSLTAAGDQTISGGGSTSFNNLTLNKTSDNLVLSSPATVEGTLTMNKGNISNGSNIFTIGTSSSSTGSIVQNSGSVLGKLRRFFATGSNSSKDFPIGTATKTMDVTVAFAATPGSNQYLTASYNAGYPQLNGADLYAGLPLTTSDGQVIQNYDDEGYWEITPGSTTTGESYSADINSAGYDLTLHMKGLTGANSASMDRTKVRIIKSAGPSHTSWVALTHGSITGSADSDYTVTASGTGFSFFGAGTEEGNALPVELVLFNGSCNDGVVDLVWQTASENNSEDFEMEYSRDGIDWNLIHTEPAAGFSTELISYTYNHKQAIAGDNYYRLTQNDIDGASVIYENLIINASCQSTSNGYFSIFPNPSGSTFQVVMNNPEIEGAAHINILDTKGNKVFTKPIVVNSGINMFVIQQDLAPGIYYINVENGTRTTTVLKQSIR